MKTPTFRKLVPRHQQVSYATPRITLDGQTTIQVYCTECGLITPHKMEENGSRCGICGHFKPRKTVENG